MVMKTKIRRNVECIVTIDGQPMLITVKDIKDYYKNINPLSGSAELCGIVGDRRMMQHIVDDVQDFFVNEFDVVWTKE